MRRPKSCVAVLGALALALASLVFLPQQAQAAPVRIMALGDSITGSPGCWRALLWQHMQNTGYTNVDFVGTLSAQGCGFSYDGENEGHGGILATNIASQNQLPAWLSATSPDVILMHLGTNDVWSAKPTSEIIAAFSTMLGQMRSKNPNTKLVVAKIIPVAPSSCGECPQRTIDLNSAIGTWAAANTTAASPISVVDQWTGWVPSTDTSDGVHPVGANAGSGVGIDKMESRWYPGVIAALNGSTVTTTTTTTTRPTTTTTTTRPTTTTTTRPTTTTTRPTTTTTRPSTTTTRPSTTTTTSTTSRTTTTTVGGTGGGCSASFAAPNPWPGGFVATVTITAGSAAINGWSVAINLPSGATVQNSWNGTVSGTSGTVTATNAAYNGKLAAGQSTQFGFQGGGSPSGTTVSCTAL